MCTISENKWGQTPLHVAAMKGYADITELLLESGAETEAKIKGDATPLHVAAFAGHTETAEVLLEK